LYRTRYLYRSGISLAMDLNTRSQESKEEMQKVWVRDRIGIARTPAESNTTIGEKTVVRTNSV